jgi:hypothetical protein
MAALAAAFATHDDASANWSQSAPEVKEKCLEYVAAGSGDAERTARAHEVLRLASAGPIHEIGPGLPQVPPGLPYGFGGLEYPPPGVSS